MRLRLRFPMIVSLFLLGPCAPSLAQDATNDTEKNSAAADEWTFTAAPYAWALGITGDVGVGDRSAHVDANFLDILQKSDSLLAFQGHLEAQRGRWGLFFDGTYADIGAEFEDQRRFLDVKADVDQKLTFIEGGTFYRIVDGYRGWQPSGDAGGGLISADLLVGARYTSLSLDVNTELDAPRREFKRDFDTDKEWVDPFVGARVEVGLTDRIDFSVRGDVGGFGVGSELTWNTQALFGFRYSVFGVAAESWAGYRAMGQDYEDNSGRDFTWDVIFHGPIVGTAFRW